MKALEFARERMESPSGGGEIAGPRRGLQSCQLQPQFGRMLGLYSGLAPFPKERFEAFVPEALDHGTL